MLVPLILLTAGALVFFSAVVQHLNTVGSRGLAFVFTDRATPLSREGFAGRAARTLQNNLESAGMVAPAATVLLSTNAENLIISIAALVYVVARIAFTLSYWAGANALRSLCWGVGMAMIALLTTNAAFLVFAGGPDAL
jgi:uncharacterized MAPEG superfamily protein